MYELIRRQKPPQSQLFILSFFHLIKAPRKLATLAPGNPGLPTAAHSAHFRLNRKSAKTFLLLIAKERETIFLILLQQLPLSFASSKWTPNSTHHTSGSILLILLTQSKSKTTITRSVRGKFNCITVKYNGTRHGIYIILEVH